MRNLRPIRHEAWKASNKLTSVCWDAAKDEVLVTFGPTEENGQIVLGRVSEEAGTESSSLSYHQVASWNAPSPAPDVPTDRIVGLHHFSDSLTTCLVLEGGDIVVVGEDGSSDGVHIEIVGSIDAGIAAAQWSPDEDLLAISTKVDTMVFMSRSFDGVAEATMTPEDLKLSKHVSVGWGKKETQFRGKGAKALRDPTIPEKVDEGTLSPHDDGGTTISWRGDGAFVAVNSIESGSRRVIRVYGREGALDSVGEPVDGLEGSLSWRPSGNLIAGMQRFSDHIDVVFFERNGLRHGQFTLSGPHAIEDAGNPIGLDWNSDSTVLAVRYECLTQLWTMGNYHWYLKQEIDTGSRCLVSAWHPEKSLRLALAASENLISAEYVSSVARGSLSPPDDHGAVAVVDGATLKITPFRTANIPPPMSMFEMSVDSSIIDVAFSPNNSHVAVLHHKGVDIYVWQTRGARSLAPKVLKTVRLGTTQASLQVCFSGTNTICVLHKSPDLEVVTCELEEAGEQLSVVSRKLAPGTILVSSCVSGHVSLQDRAGHIRQLGTNIGKCFAKFPTQLPWAEVIPVGDDVVAFGLSRNGHLYAGSRLLTKSCTSFLITPEHLVLTTNNHLLKFVHLTNIDGLELPPDDPEADERCRSIERGARLVTAIPTNMSVVMQMPRGNLETIFPRALVISGIRHLIDAKEYRKAFLQCRTQRVDMNILCDYKPEQFLANTGIFLGQLGDATFVDLFLSSLKEEDVTRTTYQDTRPSKTTEVNAGIEALPAPASKSISKVNTICDSVLKSLQAQKNASLQNIITAHVSKIPPALEDGLRVVAGLMQGGDESLAEKAVEHICFLVDVNRLYDQALGLYNLDLALLIAQESQRDPREYLPFMQELHRMPELRRKLTIDDHLGRHEKALGHLQALDVFDQVRNYTVKHNLYQRALGLYRYDTPRHNALTDLYAVHLESKSKFREAGLAHESLGNLSKAMTCYQSAGPSSWRECLFAAQRQDPPLSDTALADLATTLAEAHYEAKDYSSAATIQLEHLASLDAAVRTLCKGRLVADALRLTALHRRPDLLEAVDTALADGLAESTAFLADCRAQLRAQVPRVAELRRRAADDPLAFFEGERPSGMEDVPDDISVAATSRLSTSASLFTRYTAGSAGTVRTGATGATARRNKREEKKRARGRKGTVYEEEYLVNSLRRLVERVGETRAEVERLVFALVRRGMNERARAVEALLGEVVEECRAAVGEVWPAGGKMGDAGGVRVGEGVIDGEYSGAGGLEARALQEPPVVTEFAGLSLLG